MQFCNKMIFSFIYNKIKDKNPILSFDFEEFCQKQDIIVEFMTHAINFKIVTKLKQTFNYNFKLYNIYIIDSKKKSDSTPRRKNCKSNE